MTERALERFVRLGYATKGILYGLVGVLALQAAFTHGGSTEDPQGVLARIGGLPFGRVLLALVAAGLVGYSVWRFVQAALDPDQTRGDSGAKQAIRRVGFALSGLLYGGLAFAAARGAWRGAMPGGGRSAPNTAATLLGLPLGRTVLLAAGLVLVAAGVVQVVRGVKASFMRHLDPQARTAFTCWTGRVGLCARGLVFGLVGVFLTKAAWSRDAGEAGDSEAALDVLGQASPWLFVAVAVGFVAFALYCFVQARHRRLGVLNGHG